MRKAAFAGTVLPMFLLIFASSASPDVLKIPVGDQGANPLQATDLPRGSSPQRVESAYGKPLHIKGPVGEPPITAWEYDRHTVYFERDRLLHIVAQHVPANR